MECAPTAREAVVSVAMPKESSAPVPRLVAPSRNVTVPVGMRAGELTVAVKVTGWPKVDGFAEESAAGVVARLFAVCGRGGEGVRAEFVASTAGDGVALGATVA